MKQSRHPVGTRLYTYQSKGRKHIFLANDFLSFYQLISAGKFEYKRNPFPSPSSNSYLNSSSNFAQNIYIVSRIWYFSTWARCVMRFNVISYFITKIDNLVIVFSLTKWHNVKNDMTSCWRNFGQWYGITVEVWEWISNFILHMTRHVITYSRWEQSKSMFVKGPQLYELTHFNPVMLYGIGDFRQPRDRCWIAASLHQSIAWTNAVSVSNFRENIYRSDAQVTF